MVEKKSWKKKKEERGGIELTRQLQHKVEAISPDSEPGLQKKRSLRKKGSRLSAGKKTGFQKRDPD